MSFTIIGQPVKIKGCNKQIFGDKQASEPQHFLYDPVSIASRQLTSALATVTMTTPRSATEAEGGSSLRKPDV